jgi:hypothetical protein
VFGSSRTVFAFSRITLDHLATSFETGESHIGNGILLVVSLFCGYDRSKRGKREVDTRETKDGINKSRRQKSRVPTYGTKLVWNSFRSTLREPSNRNEAVIEETTWAMSLLRLVKLGDVMLRFFLQMS